LDEKEKFEAVIQELRDGVVVCQPDWTVTRVNRAAKNYLCLSEGDPFLERVFEHYSISEKREILADLSASHKKFDIKREHTEEFKALFLETNLDVVRNARGEPSCMVMTLRDVTQQRNENFLAFDFLALLAHKFNTPVTVIGETLDIVKPLIEKEEFHGMIGAAENQLKEIHGLSQRIIYVLEMQSKGLKDVFLADFLDGAVYRAKEKLDAKYKIAGILEKDVSVRKVALWKVIVLEELMENAYKFHGEDGLRMKLTFTDDAMTFSDNGVGIPAEEQQRIFEPFYQIYKEVHGRIPGLGLGLTLVKKLVELNRGKIEIQSDLGRGALIRIDFPPPEPNVVE
jgi:signal transduction histidine kinase